MRVILKEAPRVIFIQISRGKHAIVQHREKQKNRGKIKANPGLHERMTEKDRIRKQIK